MHSCRQMFKDYTKHCHSKPVRVPQQNKFDRFHSVEYYCHKNTVLLAQWIHHPTQRTENCKISTQHNRRVNPTRGRGQQTLLSRPLGHLCPKTTTEYFFGKFTRVHVSAYVGRCRRTSSPCCVSESFKDQPLRLFSHTYVASMLLS